MAILKKIIVWILTIEARLILAKYRPTIIAVTGSVGKTSTKDAIFSVLKKGGGFVRKSEKSLNSDIGLPLTIIGIPTAWRSMRGWISNIARGMSLILSRSEYPDTLILEVGADHPDDIRSVARWLRPHIAVITRISMTPVHVEFFSSPEEVFEEKVSLAEAVRPGGTVVLFADESKNLTIADRLKDKDVTVITFGTTSASLVRGSDNKVVYEAGVPVGISFKLEMDAAETITVKGMVGHPYMYPLLAAAAVGRVRGMKNDSITRSLEEYKAPPGRLRIIAGINGSTIIDDTYNSSPDAAVSALETLKSLETSGAKIAALGDMMELGKYSGDEHRKIGAQAVGIVSHLITVGPRSRSGTAAAAREKGLLESSVHSFTTAEEAVPHLASLVKKGDIILVKGSQSIRMERIVKALMAEPDRAGELLVRQEKEWLEKV